MARLKPSLRRIVDSVYTENNSLHPNVLWYISFCIGLVVLFILLQPKMSASLFSFSRKHAYSQLLTELEGNKSLDSSFFWQWREFYSPGAIHLNPDYVSFGDTQEIIAVASPSAVLFEYQSPLVYTKESVVHESLIKKHGGYFDRVAAANKRILFLEDTRIIYFEENGELIVQFAEPISQMQKTVGLFNFTDSEKNLLKDFYWVSQSRIIAPNY